MELFAACFVACWVAVVTPRLVQLDIAEHRLPNDIVMPGWGVAVVGILLAWLLSGSFPAVALATGIGAFVLGLVGALGGGLGMGDVKLLFPLGVGLGFLPWPAVLAAGHVAVLAGGVAGLWTLLRHRRRDAKIAFGPFLLLGFWAGYFA